MLTPKLIVMSGLPGSGKSTLAVRIASRLHATLISLDSLKESILKTGLTKDFHDGSAAWLIATNLASEQLDLGNSVIVDAINAEDAAKETWRTLAVKHKARLVVIECFVDDVNLHRKRIEYRKRNLYGIPEVTWAWVENRRMAYVPWKETTLKIDTSADTEANCVRAVEYIIDNRR